MSASPPRSPDRPTDARPHGDADLERVRDILFGAQQRSLNDQIAALERRLTDQVAALRAELLAALGRDTAAGQQHLDAAIGQVQTAWQQGRDALAADVARQFATLRDSKLDREALAGLLGGLPSRLNAPEPEKKPR